MLAPRTVVWLAPLALAASMAWCGDEPRNKETSKKDEKPDRGRELVLDLCSTCHEVERITERAMTREQWSGFIKGMLNEGAAVTDEEFALIVDYLAKNFGVPEEVAK